jgi:hypothetical protein
VELTKVPKSGERRRKKWGGSKKKTGPTFGQWATNGCLPAVALFDYSVNFFKKFGFFLIIFLEL